ncbi:MAG: hypothetical protein OEV74_18930 [Cyclobacteriaceae bacterium]|jgi:hypothetical protein|nr:hypothetical protein [Cyclobacteriaceae bacterium]MDH4298359.1 hypothetical protein [Cyclobacteriaceae bacterium]MDH5249110.1 hypothetical protein [Cyclobacteriaceae bacterium]
MQIFFRRRVMREYEQAEPPDLNNISGLEVPPQPAELNARPAPGVFYSSNKGSPSYGRFEGNHLSQQ